ncbi:Gfo/Idh/MocA family protein [Nesterenkonia aerolata]|uniref:Gfo/Idh/MocA family oxidoreductase n=1 Tax=Nesterenkonia aerolata TaxID=3074079 RepID=A0ABU2DUB5_9MICC|nr:Gfo/Idh/MocA family oxidoreductase [Nesterenkonia sp. LY-0111]MDR8019986.1 Gfo/Idh/MocA family oxidoreductase [Nesterenkonia sp. LY-0111]
MVETHTENTTPATADSAAAERPLGVAVIGAGMAGAAHAAAWRSATTVKAPFGRDVRLVAIADIAEPLAQSVAGRYGYERTVSDWRELCDADDVDIVSVVVANKLHREIVEALVQAGKHVLCEKPLSDSLEDARAMAQTARAAESVVRIGFTFRRAPGLATLRQLITDGTLGEVVHINGRYYADYSCDPDAPMTWRYRGEQGSGSLADLGSHMLYAAEFLAGPIRAVAGGRFRTVIAERHLPLRATVGHGKVALSDETETVTNDDWAGFIAEFDDASGTFETSRIAHGHPNGLRFEVNCVKGAAVWDQATPDEVRIYHDDASGRASWGNGFRTIKLGAEHPYVADGFAMAAPGIGFGHNDSFVFQARAFLEEVTQEAEDTTWPVNASFDEGLRNMEIIEAVAESARQNGSLVTVS